MPFNFAFPQLPLTSHKCVRVCLEIIVLLYRGHLQTRPVGSPRHQVPPPCVPLRGRGAGWGCAQQSGKKENSHRGSVGRAGQKTPEQPEPPSEWARGTESEPSLLMCEELTKRPAERDRVCTGARCSCKAAARCHRAGFYFSPEPRVCLAPSPGGAAHAGWAVRLALAPPAGEQRSRSFQAPHAGGPRLVRSPGKVPRLHR